VVAANLSVGARKVIAGSPMAGERVAFNMPAARVVRSALRLAPLSLALNDSMHER
jgi:hypothetical protein